MPVWNEAFPPLSREELEENLSSRRQCVCSLDAQALRSEIVRLREENHALKKCLALVRENASLRTANLIANVIGWTDDQLDNQLSRLFLLGTDNRTRNGADTRSASASNQFRPISPAAPIVSNTVQEPSNAYAKFSGVISSKPKISVSPSSSPYESRPGYNDRPNESAVMSGRYNIPPDFSRASFDPPSFGHSNKISSIKYLDSSDADERFERIEPVHTKQSTASGYKMPSSSQTVGRGDRRSAGSRKTYGNRTTSEGYGSDVGGAKGDIDEIHGNFRDNQRLVSMESGNKARTVDKYYDSAATGQEIGERNSNTTDVNSKYVQADFDPQFGSGQEENFSTSDGRKRIGEPVASSTPAKQNPTTDKSPDRKREVDSSQQQLRLEEWQKLGDVSSTDSSVLNRPIDQVIGIKPVVTDEHRFKLARIKPSKRLVGEIAFQLDRRILEYVFTFKALADKEGKQKRYYGFSIANLGQMIRKEATDERGKFNPKKELEMRYRFDYIKKTLASFGYVLDKHGQFSQDIVNKYGLFNGPPDKLTIKNFGLEDPVILRLLLSHLLTDRVELENVLVLLDCLCLLAHDDRKSIFLW